MKKALLLTILSLSFNGFAQNKKPVGLIKEDQTCIEIYLQNLKPGLNLLRIVYNEGIIRKFVNGPESNFKNKY